MKFFHPGAWWVGCLLALLPFGVLGQGNSAVMEAPAAVLDPCKRDVMKYQSNIDLVRKSLGDKAASALEAKFLSRADWDALLLKEGYCGISRKLRENKLAG